MAALNAPALLPLAVLVAITIAILTIDRANRQPRLSAWMALTGLIIAPVLSLIVITSGQGGIVQNTLSGSGSSALWMLLLCSAGAVIVVIDLGKKGAVHNLHYVLILLLICGALIVVQAAHLIALGIGAAIVYVALGALSGPQDGFRQVLLGGMSLACLLFGSACLYGATGTLQLSSLAGQTGQTAGSAANPLALLGLDLCVAGTILLPAVLIAGPFPNQREEQTTAIMARTLLLPLVGIAGSTPWIALLPHNQVLLLGTIGAVGIAAGYALALRARQTPYLWTGVAVAEFARLALTASMLPGEPGLFLQAVGSTSAIAGLWTLSAHLRNENSRRLISSAEGLGLLRPGARIGLGLCLFSLSGLPPLIGAIGQIWLLRQLVEASLTWVLALTAIGQWIAWLWAARWLIDLWLHKPSQAPSEPLAPAAGTILLIAAAGIVLVGLYAGPILDWIETMLAL